MPPEDYVPKIEGTHMYIHEKFPDLEEPVIQVKSTKVVRLDNLKKWLDDNPEATPTELLERLIEATE